MAAEEGEAWFRNWLQREPHNENAWNVFSWCVQEQEDAEAAYRLIRKEVIDVPCTIHNSLLFERAKLLAQHVEKNRRDKAGMELNKIKKGLSGNDSPLF